MAYDNFLNFGYDNRPQYFSAGAKRILFVKADAIQSLVYAEKDVVDAIGLRSGVQWNMFNRLDNVSYLLEPKTDEHGTIYAIEIGFTVSVQTTQKNRLFDSMRNTDLVAIIEDMNFRWWLVGLEQPLRLTTQQQKTDNDNNQYTLKLTTTQRENVKEMSTVFTQGLTEDMFTSLVDSTDGVTLDIHVATNNAGQSPVVIPALPNNFIKTVTHPPSGYVILDDVGIVLAAPGSSVKLPAAALNGQWHTVKDDVGLASTASILVFGNGHQVDGAAGFTINTDYGSVTFIYNNGAWFTTSGVN